MSGASWPCVDLSAASRTGVVRSVPALSLVSSAERSSNRSGVFRSEEAVVYGMIGFSRSGIVCHVLLSV